MSETDLIKRDLQHIWHPCSQMKDFEQCPPLPITHATGSYFYTMDGQPIIDAISSWWCKSLGHAHPKLQAALTAQLKKMEHVILANTTNETIVALSEALSSFTQHWQHPLNKVLFASDGSCAVEMALKMSLHIRQIQGQSERTQLAALQNAYHGETLLTLAVSDLGLYKAPYAPWLQDTTFLQPVPYVSNRKDPLWHDCAAHWQTIEKQLAPLAGTLTALIIEPIIQGAAGMQVYSADLLRRLSAWCDTHDVHLIADEIMTGIGRTGYPLACDHAGIEPDFVCLAKSLTAGLLPMSVCLTSTPLYDYFYDDYATGKAFMHSHTHSGNTLAAAVALATLEIMETENYYQQVCQMESYLAELMQDVAQRTQALTNIRVCGAMVAADLIPNPTLPKRLGYAVYQAALPLGALLRPLGNTLYWIPPFNISRDTLDKLHDITIQAINTVVQSKKA